MQMTTENRKVSLIEQLVEVETSKWTLKLQQAAHEI